MIPRKRLQVLLYILQIFYVFGDGDPGSEEQIATELPDNVIDDTALTTTIPSMDQLIHTNNKYIKNNTNSSQEIFNSKYEQKQDEMTNTSKNVIVTEDLDSIYSDIETVENVTLDDIQSNSLNISWRTSGGNIKMFKIDLYLFDLFVETYNTSNLNYSIKNLRPCAYYKVGVKPLTANSDMKFVYANTSFSKPGPAVNLDITVKKPFSLLVTWDIPTTAGFCVKSYRIVINTGSDTNKHVISDLTNDTTYTFVNLHPCFSYVVSVTPIDNNNEDAPSISNTSLPIHANVSFAPILVTSDTKTISTTKNSITLIWNVANKNNNCTVKSIISICNYNFSDGNGYELRNGSIIVNITSKERPENISTVINDLSPFTHYQCMAQIINDHGKSPWSLSVSVQTKEDVPSAPQNFQNFERDENSKLMFAWNPPKYRPGKILGYRIHFNWHPQFLVPTGCKKNRELIVDNIDPNQTQYTLLEEEAYSQYFAYISAKTAAGWSQEIETIEFDSTTEAVPDKVTNLTCTIKRKKGSTTALETELSWLLPCSLGGILHYFEISAIGTRYGFENHTIEAEVNALDNSDINQVFRYNFGELKPLYNYTFEVAARLIGFTESGEIANLTLEYPAGIPPQPDVEYVKSITLDPHKARRTTSSAAILLPLFPDSNGKVKYYAVMVSGVSFDNSSSAKRFDIKQEKWPNVSSWEEAMEKDFKIPYQATEPLWNPFPSYVVDYGHMKAAKFVVGEDTTCPEVSSNTKNRAYCNGPLKPDTWYQVQMRAFTETGYADSVPFTIKTNAELNLGFILGIVFGILFIAILTTVMLLVKRCSFRSLMQRIAQSNLPESPVPDPFTRRKFMNHCQYLAENPVKLSNEFQLLQTLSIDLQMPSNAACLQANRKKNRYSDILPYDFSRVKLEVIDNDPNTDYINASFVRGYSGNEEYIACQGPKEDTTHDFWRMIEQYDVKMILMLTQLVERGKEKCHQYFPAYGETFNYEKISVKCTNELDYRTYTQRIFVLQKEDKTLNIAHLHFKDWPDHDVPDDFDAMIHFCQIFRKKFTTLNGLSVIHCSAGIGRTGTLIAIDILLQSIKDNRKLDVFGTVYRLRRHRLNMVQRESQYAYIYNCIRQVLKNPYSLKSYKPPPIDPIYSKSKTRKDRSDSNTDLVNSFDTLRKNSLSTSVDSMQPLCQSSPQASPKIPMNVLFAGLRYCKSTGAIDARSNHNRIGRYNSEGYAICDSARDSFSTTSKESIDESDLKNSSSSLYENVEPLIRQGSSQSITGSCYLTNDSVEKDTSL